VVSLQYEYQLSSLLCSLQPAFSSVVGVSFVSESGRRAKKSPVGRWVFSLTQGGLELPGRVKEYNENRENAP
jgi:hypothetical protein